MGGAAVEGSGGAKFCGSYVEWCLVAVAVGLWNVSELVGLGMQRGCWFSIGYLWGDLGGRGVGGRGGVGGVHSLRSVPVCSILGSLCILLLWCAGGYR